MFAVSCKENNNISIIQYMLDICTCEYSFLTCPQAIKIYQYIKHNWYRCFAADSLSKLINLSTEQF